MALTSAQHKELAEDLLREAVTVHDKISHLADVRSDAVKKGLELDPWDASKRTAHNQLFEDLTRQMDEYGKKIMGIFVQAQVHATLATIPDPPAERRRGPHESKRQGFTL